MRVVSSLFIVCELIFIMVVVVGEALLILESVVIVFVIIWNETERFVYVVRKLIFILKDILKYKFVIMLIWSFWFCFYGDNII